MPIYEFQCTSCGAEVEVLQKISDPHLVDCEACGKPHMKKKVTAAAFRLSGAGWYETDFKNDNKKNLTESFSDKDSKSSDDKKGSADSSDTKTSTDSKKNSDKPAKTTKSETKSTD